MNQQVKYCNVESNVMHRIHCIFAPFLFCIIIKYIHNLRILCEDVCLCRKLIYILETEFMLNMIIIVIQLYYCRDKKSIMIGGSLGIHLRDRLIQ